MPDVSVRGQGFLAAPAERVRDAHPFSTLMPREAPGGREAFGWSALVASSIVVTAAVLGAIGPALAAGAVLFPLCYVVYLYDVNVYHDKPVPVVAATMVWAGIVGAAGAVLARMLLEGQSAALRTDDVGPLLVPEVLLPVVAALLAIAGPLYLASRPEFDDQIDGFTFGVAAGAGLALGETLALFWPTLLDRPDRADVSITWLAVIITQVVLKPLVYGTALGIAAGRYSGLGPGYTGFGPDFYRALTFALVTIGGLNLGQALLDLYTVPAMSMLWSGAVALALLVRARVVLQEALVEQATLAEVAALEAEVTE